MASLYELNKMYFEALEGAIDENGEIQDERLVELMGEIQEAKETKLLNVACMIKDLNGDIDKFDAEIKQLQARKKAVESKVASLEKLIRLVLPEGEKLKETRAEISWCKSSSVLITSEPSDLYKQYPDLVKVKTEYQPDKKAIKERIELGDLVLGCSIETKQSLVIK